MFGRKKTQETPQAPEPVARSTSFSTESTGSGVLTPLQKLAKIQEHFVTPSMSGTGQDSSTGLIPSFKAELGAFAGAPDSQFLWYSAQGFIGYQVAAIMAQHWLVDKCCLMPARDAVRVGYDVSIAGEHPRADEVVEAFKKQDKRYGINKAMTEFIHMGRVYGVRVAIFRVESSDPDYYAKPFNPDGVTPGSYKGISQIDPIWCVPELTSASVEDPANMRFYQPEFYVVGGQRYHRSHLCVYIPYPVADALKPTYQYGGPSLPQRIYERVYAAERTANEAPQLAMTKRLVVFKTDANAFWANLKASTQRLFDWILNRDNYGAYTCDKETEDVVQLDTSLADLDATIMTQYQLAAAIAEVPATKLLSTQPKGFNSTGDYEAESYRQTLESIQCNDLQPLLDKHHKMVWLSEIKPKLGITDDLEFEATWRPLDSPTAAEWAAINLQKAQTAQIYAGMGAIDGEDVRQQLRQDKDSDFFGLVEETELDLNDDPEAEANPQA